MQDEGTFLRQLLESCAESDTYLRNQLKRIRGPRRRLYIKGQIEQVRWFRNQVKGYLMIWTIAQERKEECLTD